MTFVFILAHLTADVMNEVMKIRVEINQLPR